MVKKGKQLGIHDWDTHRRSHRRRSIQGYEIRVAGHLEEDAMEWYGEFTIANQGNGDALLSCPIPDQAALMRVLLHLNDLGLTILSVTALKNRR